jgi:hypothetical protein
VKFVKKVVESKEIKLLKQYCPELMADLIYFHVSSEIIILESLWFFCQMPKLVLNT